MIERKNKDIPRMKISAATKVPSELEEENITSVLGKLLKNGLPYSFSNQSTEKCRIMKADIASNMKTVNDDRQPQKVISKMLPTEDKEKDKIATDENIRQRIFQNKNSNISKEIVIAHQAKDGNVSDDDTCIKDEKSNCLDRIQEESKNYDTDSNSEDDYYSDDNASNCSVIDKQNGFNDRQEIPTKALLETNITTISTEGIEEKLTKLEIGLSVEKSEKGKEKDESKEKFMTKPVLKLNIPTSSVPEVEGKLKNLTINQSLKEIKTTGELVERSPMKILDEGRHMRTCSKPYSISSQTLQSGGIIAHISASSTSSVQSNNTYLQPNVQYNIGPFSPANSPESNVFSLPPSPQLFVQEPCQSTSSQFPYVPEQCPSEMPLPELTLNDLDEILSMTNNNNNSGQTTEYDRNNDAVVPSLDDSLIGYMNSPEPWFPESVAGGLSSAVNTTQQTDPLCPAIEHSCIQSSIQYTQHRKADSFTSISSPGTTFSSSGSPFPSDSSSPSTSPIPSPANSSTSTSELGKCVENLILPKAYISLSDISDNSNISTTTDDFCLNNGQYFNITGSVNESLPQFVSVDQNENSCFSVISELSSNSYLSTVSSDNLNQNEQSAHETQFIIPNSNFRHPSGQSPRQLQPKAQSNNMLIQKNRHLGQLQPTTQIQNNQSLQNMQSTTTNMNNFSHSMPLNANSQQTEFVSPIISVGNACTSKNISNYQLHVVSQPANILVQNAQSSMQSASLQAQTVQNQLPHLQQTKPATTSMTNTLQTYTFATPVVVPVAQNILNVKNSVHRSPVPIIEGPVLPKIEVRSAKERLLQKLIPVFHLQARAQLSQLSDELLSSGDEIDGDTQLMVLIMNTAKEHRLEFVYELVNRIKDIPGAIDARNKMNQSALYLASMHWADEPLVARFIAETLLEKNVNIDEVYNDGNSLVHFLCMQGDSHVKVLTELLSIRDSKDMPCFDVNRHNYLEGSPLHIAVKRHSHRVDCKSTVRFLLSQGAKVLDKERCRGQTALHIAVRESCSPGMVQALLQDSASRNIDIVNQKDYGGDMPLHLAASRNDVHIRQQVKTIELLMRYGAISNCTGSMGKMPLALVSAERKNDIQNIIRRK